MNNNQLATLDEAKTIAQEIGTIGGGVKAVTDDPTTSGIYIPSWGYYAVPSDGDSKFYFFRFENGADGFNVGLVRQTMQVFPSRWLLMISTEVNAAANWASLNN
jgi:hypothetical protein